MTVLELEPAICGSEASIGTEVRQRGHETLIDIQRGELVKLLEKISALRHYLRQQRYRLRGAFSYERAELSSTQKHCGRLFRRAGISDVATVRGKSFASECLSFRRNDRNESASDFDLVAQNDVAIQNDEYAVSGCSALIELKSRGPVRLGTVGANGRHFFRSET